MRSLRGALWNGVRLLVTVVAVAYVVSKIVWLDQLAVGIDPDAVPLYGHITRDSAEEFVFVVEGTHEWIPLGPDLPEDGSFVPGFISIAKGLRWKALILGFIAFPVPILFLGWRWQWLLATYGIHIPLSESVRLTWLGMFANNFMLGSTGGDVAKAYCIYRRTPGKRVPAILTVFMDRAIGLFALMMVGAMAIGIRMDRAALHDPSALATIGLLFAGGAGGILFFSGRLRRLFRVSQTLARLPYGEKLKQIDESIFHYRNHLPTLAKCVAISLVIHLWTIGCMWLLGRAVNAHASIMAYYAFIPVAFTVAAIPISINGLGVMETVLQGLFKTVGVSAASAFALCVLYRIVALLISLPGAIPFYRECSPEVRSAISEESMPPVADDSVSPPSPTLV